VMNKMKTLVFYATTNTYGYGVTLNSLPI
jgi:hypothetical protein